MTPIRVSYVYANFKRVYEEVLFHYLHTFKLNNYLLFKGKLTQEIIKIPAAPNAAIANSDSNGKDFYNSG